MSLLNSASLVVTPNGYKEGTLYSVIPNTTLGDMTVVRATTATRVNSAGLIELVPYNLLTYSEALTPNYTFNQCSITSNQTDPNGTNNAKRITNGGTANDAYFEQSIGITNNTYTWSIFVKQGTATTATIRPVHVGIGGDVSLLTFTFATQTITSSGLITTSGFIALPNGWFRIFCSIPITNAVSSLRGRFGNPNTPNVYNDWFGAQLVEGSTAKDYLRTETRLNIPRLDYSNGTCPSILVEPQRTNVKTNSENASGSNWGTAVRVNATINSIASPDGNVTANSIADTAVSGTHAFEPSFSATSGTAYTFSVFAKANTLSQVVIYGYADNGVFAGQQAIFNITNGTVISNTGGGTTNVVNYGNGYYRVSLTLTSGATSTGYWAFGLAKNGLASYLGDGSSLYMWGCQLEAGSYPTSYIPTTSAAVTRNADAISKTGISALIGQTEGVFYLDLYASAKNNDANTYATWLVAGNASDNFQIYNIGTTLYWYARNTASVFIDQSADQTIVEGTRYKIAFAYKSGDYALYINGVQKRTNANANVPVALSQFNLSAGGFGASPAIVKNEYNSAVLFPTRLTNAELSQLTTI